MVKLEAGGRTAVAPAWMWPWIDALLGKPMTNGVGAQTMS